jgi:long-chain acyl-CoA synthetase
MAPELPPKETLPNLIRQALSVPRAEVIVERVDGKWTPTSSAKLLERIENLACAIRDAGLNAGDRIALIAHDCVDWIVCDFATLFAGCVVVPIYPTQALDHTQYILEHSQAKLLFVDTPETAQRLRAGATLPPIVVFGGGSNGLDAFETRGATLRAQHPELPATLVADAKPDDLAVLIYTSGTTGNPKGVMLSHDNVGFDAQSALKCALEAIPAESDVLSVLPYSHIFEHTMVYIYFLGRMRYNVCHDPNALLDDLRDVRPFAMTCVPRIFDRVLAGITGQAMKHGGLQAKLVPWALRVGRDYMQAKTFGSGPNPLLGAQYAIAKRLVFDKVRTKLGLDRLRYFTSGSAALHVDVAMTYLAMGMPIMQGYGLTETSPVITVNRLSQNRYGSVGPPITGAEVKIASDGEILTRGRQVMMGYYRDPESTAATIVDGWLHTGDIGEVDANGFLRVTDRKKEVFKTATGKFVSPSRVESALKRSIFVAQAMVVGDGHAYPTALVCPNWDLVRVELGIPADVSSETMAQRSDVIDFMAEQARSRTSDLGSYEQIRRVILVPREFSVESGELSPSMKIKRRVVEERYRDAIESAYAADPHAYSHA